MARTTREMNEVDARDQLARWIAKIREATGADAEDNDGLRDGAKDVKLSPAAARQLGVKAFQHKASVSGGIAHLRGQIARRRFVPLVVGGPPRDADGLKRAASILLREGGYVSPGAADTASADQLEDFEYLLEEASKLPWAHGTV